MFPQARAERWAAIGYDDGGGPRIFAHRQALPRAGGDDRGISLGGRILAVRGIREKLVAAAREGLRKVCIPGGNGREAGDLPRSLRGKLETATVSTLDERFAQVLGGAPEDVAKARGAGAPAG